MGGIKNKTKLNKAKNGSQDILSNCTQGWDSMDQKLKQVAKNLDFKLWFTNLLTVIKVREKLVHKNNLFDLVQLLGTL